MKEEQTKYTFDVEIPAYSASKPSRCNTSYNYNTGFKVLNSFK